MEESSGQLPGLMIEPRLIDWSDPSASLCISSRRRHTDWVSFKWVIGQRRGFYAVLAPKPNPQGTVLHIWNMQDSARISGNTVSMEEEI